MMTYAIRKPALDYIHYGICLKHFVLPPRGMSSEGFDVDEMCIEKIGELKARLRDLKKNRRFSNNWFFNYLYAFSYEQERFYIEKWIVYWKRLAGADKVAFPRGSITDGDIARAREFPIQNLFEGQLRHVGGDNFVGLCPFHQEKTPSFHIYPDHYFCYGCQTYGDAIDYLMTAKKLGFVDAVKELA